ncbi:hypothetical protein MXB_2723 [Myxobolus squamalis]|nr:hypothetical protein MXB_2723 [Myxobolus squamalis]
MIKKRDIGWFPRLRCVSLSENESEQDNDICSLKKSLEETNLSIKALLDQAMSHRNKALTPDRTSRTYKIPQKRLVGSFD